MQKGKNLQYAMAGVQAAPGTRMNVRSNVSLPDSEAGSYDENDRVPFRAPQVRPRDVRRSVTIPANIGLGFLFILLIVFGVLILVRVNERAELSKEIDATKASIIGLVNENAALAVDLAEAREPSRIDFVATHELHMIASSEVAAIPVMAPDTRPAIQTASAAADSPSPALDGILTGSR